MGFRQGAYCRVWQVEDKGNYSVARVSISKKNKQTDQYETEWQDNFCRLVGTAHQQAKTMDFSHNVKIGSCDVTNKYDAEKKVTYTNYVIFGFEEDGDQKPAAKPTPAPGNNFVNVPDGIEDEGLPFN